ncbi:MAG: hypothetical protein VKN13_02155 [Cyanobacteriota bacterium]|nr:hypothetical protein [Cyanobacteriota bacterium]
MGLTLPVLVSLTLMVCAAVAMVPDIVRDRRPRLPPPQARSLSQAVWLVRAPGDRWLIDGQTLSSDRLAVLLARQPRGTSLHVLVSSRLTAAEVSEAMGWLRRQRGQAVRLELGEALP